MDSVSWILLVAGVVAGVLGSAGGMTSLVSYGSLIAVGVPMLDAGAANMVASVACGPGSALASRRELRAVHVPMTLALPTVAAGGAVGAVLLAHASATGFSRVVPWLVAAASLGLAAQPWLAARLRGWNRRSPAVAWGSIGAVSIYGGFFGAGYGIMLLTLVLLLVDDRMPEANALKNLLAGVVGLASAAVLGLSGPVDWLVVAPLAVGLFAGSTLGPAVARRVPAVAIRWGGVVLGAVLAGSLWCGVS
ncbi:sulfite exporter TauE/SafE family protein [Pseudonocardia phyllosphaerae]|uniref:sulfite exporter TauE/SafE family protein n=1 Tax=Pseudonocardia phyllosphaerae TaxID=3390502 RepID=UPI003979027C